MNLFTIESLPFWLCKNFGPPDLSIFEFSFSSSMIIPAWYTQDSLLFDSLKFHFDFPHELLFTDVFLLLFAFFEISFCFFFLNCCSLMLLILSFLINFQFRFLIVLQLSFKLVYHKFVKDNWLQFWILIDNYYSNFIYFSGIHQN